MCTLGSILQPSVRIFQVARSLQGFWFLTFLFDPEFSGRIPGSFLQINTGLGSSVEYIRTPWAQSVAVLYLETALWESTVAM